MLENSNKLATTLFLLSLAIALFGAWILSSKAGFETIGLVSNPTGTVSASVQSTIDIFLKNATVNFGAVQVGASYDTSVNYSNASQFLLRNDGSVKVNVTITTTWLWTSVCVASHFRFNVTNASGNTSVPSNCNNYNQSTWYSIPNPDDLACSPLIFPSGATFNFNAFSNSELGLPFKLINDIASKKSTNVSRPGIEPGTYSLRGNCSTN